MKRTGALLLALALAVTGACGDDDDDDDGGGATSSCSPFTPHPQWQGVISGCQYPDATVEITNESTLVLVASAPGGSGLDVRTGAADDPLTAAAMDELFRRAVAPSVGTARVPPGATVVARTSGGAQTVLLAVDQALTVEAYAVNTAAGWVKTKLSRPGASLARSTVTCADEVSDLWSARSGPVEAALIDAVQGGVSCYRLSEEVYGSLDQRPPAIGTFSDEMRNIGRRVGSGFVDEALRFLRLAATS